MYETDRDYAPPAAPGAPASFRSPGCYVNIALVALFAMVTVSLALNFALIVTIVRVRSAALDALDQAGAPKFTVSPPLKIKALGSSAKGLR